MPTVITPTGEYIDDQTGRPFDPRSAVREGERIMPKEFNPRSVVREGEEMVRSFDPSSAVREGEMARENIPANMDMGMDSEMLDPRSVVREGEQTQAMLPIATNPANDLNIAYRALKSIDPRSATRNGEMADETGNPVAELYNSLLQGNRLTNEQRNSLMGMQNSLDPKSVVREDEDDVAKAQMLIDMGLPPADAMEAVAREKVMNQNPINPEAFSGGAVVGSDGMAGSAAGVTNVDPSMGGLGALPTPRGAKDMGMPENGMVADLMRRGYTPDMISAMAGGNMPPREDDAMNLERTTAPTPMR
tara:strand:+ start:1059 stop:1970 length:912 start_codon:yes stop_codon:yes gene_type:complete